MFFKVKKDTQFKRATVKKSFKFNYLVIDQIILSLFFEKHLLFYLNQIEKILSLQYLKIYFQFQNQYQNKFLFHFHFLKMPSIFKMI